MSKSIKETHIEEALGRFIEQFKESQKLKSLTRALLSPINEIEKTAADLVNLRDLENAQGPQLDGIGDNIGELRAGRNDEDYRQALILRVFINTSGGTPNEIISIARQITNSDNVRYTEIYPASFQLFLDGETISQDTTRRIRQVTPAGVGAIVVNTSFGLTPFAFQFTPQEGGGFAEVDGTPINVGGGKVLSLSNGNFLGIYNKNVEPSIDQDDAGSLTEVFTNV